MLSITPNEYKLLRVLTSSPGTVVTRRLLLEKLWDKDGNFIDDHTLTVTVNRLRSKIEMEPILTSKPFGVWATSGRERQHEGPGHGPGLRAAVVALGGLICLWAMVWEALPLPLLRGGLLAFGFGGGGPGGLAGSPVAAADGGPGQRHLRYRGRPHGGKGFPAVQTYEDSVTAKVRASFSNTMRRWPTASARAQRTSRPSRNW